MAGVEPSRDFNRQPALFGWPVALIFPGEQRENCVVSLLPHDMHRDGQRVEVVHRLIRLRRRNGERDLSISQTTSQKSS